MKMRFFSAIGLMVLVGCGSSDSESLPKIDCSTVTAPTYAEVKAGAFAKCTTCHATTFGATRPDNAPKDVNFDTYAEAKSVAEEAAGEVNGGSMPPTGFPKLSEEEKQQLYQWALCGTPQ